MLFGLIRFSKATSIVVLASLLCLFFANTALAAPISEANFEGYTIPKTFKSLIQRRSLGCFYRDTDTKKLLTWTTPREVSLGAITVRPISRRSIVREVSKLSKAVLLSSSSSTRLKLKFARLKLSLFDSCQRSTLGDDPNLVPTPTPTPPEGPNPGPTGSPTETPTPTASPTASPTGRPAITITDATGNGISWTVRRAASQPAGAVSYGQFVNGDYWVVGPVELISVTPGHALSNGVDVHGSVLNFDPNGAFQGLDGRCVSPGTGCTVEFMKPYQQSLNVTRNLASGPLTILAGNSLMTVRSRLNMSVPSSDYKTGIMDASVLTVLASQPPSDAFRPAYAGTDKTIYFRESNINWSRLLSMPVVPGAPSITAVANQLRRVWLDHDEWNARMIHPFNNMPEYGRDFTALMGEALVLANMNFTQAQKRDLVIRIAQIGIDFYANVVAGATWNGTGGQGSGRKAQILFAGALFNNAGLLGIGVNYPSYRAVVGGNLVAQAIFGEDSQTFFVEQTSPGIVNWQSPATPLTPYNMSHVGNPRLPEWGFNHVDYPSNDNPGWNANPYRRCCTANSWVGQTIAMKWMGLEDEWNHPALFQYMDRYMSGQLSWIQTDPVNQQNWHRSWITWLETAWDTYRPALGGIWSCNFPTNICLGQ